MGKPLNFERNSGNFGGIFEEFRGILGEIFGVNSWNFEGKVQF